MFVTGTGISGTVKVASLTNQNSIVLDSAQSISDNTVLTFGTFHGTQVNKSNNQRISISGDVVCIAKDSKLLENMMPPLEKWDKI